jgi:hypothetical protein
MVGDNLTPEQLERLRGKMEERSNRVVERNSTSIVYVPDGVTKFRPYLDSNGEVFRSGFRHKFLKTSVNCLGVPQCKICNRLNEIKEGWEGNWRFASQEFVLMYVWIFECSDNNNQYIKMNEPVILMGNARLANEVSYQVKDIDSIEDMKLMFSPHEPSLMWQLRFDRDKKNLSLGYYNRKATMDPLPDSFPPLSQAYFKEGQAPSAEKEMEFIREMEKAYQKNSALKTSVSSNTEETITPPEPVQRPVEVKPPVQAPVQAPVETPQATAPIRNANYEAQEKVFKESGKRFPSKVTGEVPPCFGNHNDDYDDPDCLLCKIESKCEVATKK